MTRSSAGEKHAEEKDFTEANYGRLLELAASKYRFESYGAAPEAPFVIWRHDVDYSPQRALAFAKIEAVLGLRCIYHVLVSSRYYNILEPDTGVVIRQIAGLGHEIGLHFDMDVGLEAEAVSREKILDRIGLEKRLIEAVAGVPVTTMSFHNYVLHESRLDRADEICGMLNSSTKAYQDGYKYVSDSNGIWRYDRLEDVLSEPPFPRLHVLTHPVWWTPEPMPPVMRLRRVVDGRASANFDFYAAVMERDGRFKALAERLGFPAARSNAE